jgi:hypothetical protein
MQPFTTDGEGAFYRFLQAVAVPGSRCIAWHQPDIMGHEPDFIHYLSCDCLPSFPPPLFALSQGEDFRPSGDQFYFPIYNEVELPGRK